MGHKPLVLPPPPTPLWGGEMGVERTDAVKANVHDCMSFITGLPHIGGGFFSKKL
jgi:hypothetical protein